MKMSNKKFIIDNLINLIAISEAYFIKFNKLNLVNKVYLFTKETIFRIEENVAKIDKEKETILLNRNNYFFSYDYPPPVHYLNLAPGFFTL